MNPRTEYMRRYNAARPARQRGKHKYHRPTCLGLDGEGFESGSVYAYMACSSRTAEISTCEDLRGLSTQAVLDWLLDLPRAPLKFGFSLGYDYTHWLKDLPNEDLYKLCRPECRLSKDADGGAPEPVLYYVKDKKGLVTDTYQLNMLGTRLSVQKMVGHGKLCENLECPGCRPGPRTVIWDVFRFFQSSFVKACLDWGVISQAEFETLREMKAKRPDFAKPKAGPWGEGGKIVDASSNPDWIEIKRYCGLECRKMAELAEKLLDAHQEAGLRLRQYFGAGSTGAAMLDKMHARGFIRVKHVPKANAKDARVPVGKGGKNYKATGAKVQWRNIEYDPDLHHAIACAFFGGRFEIAQYGPIEQECWSYDISSAYPYAFTFLPCLVHGKWRLVCGTAIDGGLAHDHVHKEVVNSQTAIVRYRLPYSRFLGFKERADETSPLLWGPFPFRMGKGLEPFCNPGDIVFPVTSGGGWVGRDEYLAGHAFAPNVVATEAWIYETPCDCKVLRHLMPQNYKMRMLWGKEGKGVVAKLGQNSCYGKCAQTKGRNPPYQEFVWALLTTGSCRAQLLRAMNTDKPNIVLLATDGIISKTRLTLSGPKDTGTAWAPCAVPKEKDKKNPIYREDPDSQTGWVCNKPLGGWEEKPLPNGVFLIRPGIAFPLGTNEESEFKARGIGKGVLRNLRQRVTDGWYAQGPTDHKTKKQLFFGMKSQVYLTPKGEYKRTPRYGRFGMQDQVISFDPTPKRPTARADGVFDSWALHEDRTSIPYGPILGKPKAVSPLVEQLKAEKLLDEDQDDFRDEEIREF
jgi:hypothetical protein